MFLGPFDVRSTLFTPIPTCQRCPLPQPCSHPRNRSSAYLFFIIFKMFMIRKRPLSEEEAPEGAPDTSLPNPSAPTPTEATLEAAAAAERAPSPSAPKRAARLAVSKSPPSAPEPAVASASWTPTDDRRLVEAVRVLGPCAWPSLAVTYFSGTRTSQACEERWKAVRSLAMLEK